jgi:hypothetical protein
VLPQDADIIKFYVLETRKKNHENPQDQLNASTVLERLSNEVIQNKIITPELEKFMSVHYIDTILPTEVS